VERLEVAVQRALDKGNLEEAFSAAVTLLDRHPDLSSGRHAVRAVVGEQIREHISSRAFDAAHERLDSLQGRWSWLPARDLRTDVQLSEAGVLFDQMKHDRAYELLGELLERDSDNLRIARAMVERFGAAYTHGARKKAFAAAFTVARHTEGRLEAPVADTLLAGYFSFGPFGPDAEFSREILLERHPPAVTAAAERLLDRSESTRVNAYHLLRDAGELSDEQALAYHFQNLTTLSSASKNTLLVAADWVEERSGQPDWEALKRRAELPAAPPLRIMSDFGERPARLCALLAGAFMPELTDVLLETLSRSEDYRRRCNAYGILRDAGALERVDRDRHHARVLMSFPTKSIHRCYDEAVAWFAAAEGDRVPAARAALEAGRAAAAEALEAYKKAAKPGWNSEFWPERAERNLAKLDAALESLQE